MSALVDRDFEMEHVCALIAEGKPAAVACREAKVNRATFYVWLDENPRAKDRYARAKESMLQKMADELISIADTVDTESPAAVNKARLQIDSRKFLLSKLNPGTYGDSIKVDQTVHAGESVVAILRGRIEQQKQLAEGE